MNRLDLFLLALIALAGVTGWRRGLLHRVLSWGGLLAGVALGAILAPMLAGGADPRGTRGAVALGALVVGGTLGALAGRLIGTLLRGGARGTAVGTVDSVAGMLLSVAVVSLIAWFLALNLANGPFASVAEEVRGSAVIRGLDGVLPDPPDLLAQVSTLVGNSDFPRVFAWLPPAPVGTVAPPSDEEVGPAVERASGSVALVWGTGCGRIQEGSGFVAADRHILTNAHVVAGTDHVTVQTGERTLTGSVVLFDPDLDVAVIRVPESAGDALTLSADEAPRGAVGAILGHPGGGELAGSPAAVTRVIDAKGRDIYDSERVIRRVYELQARVVPGSSGGPFVLPDGRVAGMVFASSTSDPAVGYAITSQRLSGSLERGIQRIGPVETGPCTP